MADNNVTIISSDSTGNKKGRPSKKNLYEKERQELLEKLYGILGINKNNKVFYLEDIDANKDKINQIIGLSDDVRKYFICSNWIFFTKLREVSRPWLSLTNNIFKAMGIKTKRGNIKDNIRKIVIKTGYHLLI